MYLLILHNVMDMKFINFNKYVKQNGLIYIQTLSNVYQPIFFLLKNYRKFYSLLKM